MIDYTRRIESDILEQGQFIQGMLGSPPWTYTIGNVDRGMPELVMTGIDPRVALGILNEAGDRMRSEYGTFVAGAFLHEIASTALRVDVVHPSQIQGMMQQSVYREMRLGTDPHALRALQLVWPDRNGIFPGEPGCMISIMAAQRLLSEPLADAGD